jgi:hypothetical protein
MYRRVYFSFERALLHSSNTEYHLGLHLAFGRKQPN